MQVERELKISHANELAFTVETQLQELQLYANICELNDCLKFHMQMSSRLTVASQLSFNSRSTRVQPAFNSCSTCIQLLNLS